MNTCPRHLRRTTWCSTIVRALALVAALSMPVSIRAVHHVVIGDVSSRDWSRPMYDVTFPPLGTGGGDRATPLQHGEDADVMRVVSARGQAMNCAVPRPLESDEDVESMEDSFESVEELMDEYRGKCFRRNEGWWQYIFCYGVHVEQRHDTNGQGDETVSYILGELDPGFDAEWRRGGAAKDAVTNAIKVDSEAPYTQLFGNGTMCDVNGRAREIVVRYKCNKDAFLLGENADMPALNYISKVQEVNTCEYVIDFVNEQICKHPAYRKQSSLLKIYCVMAEGEGDFLGLSSSVYQKASINL